MKGKLVDAETRALSSRYAIGKLLIYLPFSLTQSSDLCLGESWNWSFVSQEFWTDKDVTSHHTFLGEYPVRTSVVGRYTPPRLH
jgi:hypothetical protein